MVHTIIFDVGGTLIGCPDIFEELREHFPSDNKNVDYELIKDTFLKYYEGMSRGEIEFRDVASIIEQVLSDVSEIFGYKNIKSRANDICQDIFCNKAFLYNDTISTLEYLKSKNIELIIASDADAQLLYHQLEKFDLMKYFSHCFISSEIKAYKPSTKFVDKIKQVLKEPLDEILFVGDSKVDILTGKKLKVKTVLKTDGRIKNIGNDYSIEGLKELKNIILLSKMT